MTESSSGWSSAHAATDEPSPRFLPFALPDIGEIEIAGVLETLRNGWLTTGPQAKRFEAAFAAYLGDGIEAVAVNSATAGLHLALEALGIAPGDEVIVPTYTFTATAEVVRYLGAHPVFVDCDPETFNMRASDVEAAITSRTHAVIPVHFGGLACDLTAIQEVADRHGLRVIEDAAHALPSTHRSTLVGTGPSDAVVFSFYATKTLATGEGGMIVTRSAKIADRCRTMRLHGINRDAFDRYTTKLPSWQYEVVAAGYKYNLTDVAAAIGLGQLQRLDSMHCRRELLAQRYDLGLDGLPCDLPPAPPPGDKHARHLYVIRLRDDAPVPRDRFIEHMAELGIGCSVHFIPLHMQPVWRDTYQLRSEQFPNATRAFSRVVSLPLYSKMTDGDQKRVIAAVTQTLTA
jgi:dTDP-4-amino-4,6-dideoxygalactose transaminase